MLQILTLYDSINVIDVNKVVEYVQSLQKEDGSFAGDIWGNVHLIHTTQNTNIKNLRFVYMVGIRFVESF